MSDTDLAQLDRTLIACFREVFPYLDEGGIRAVRKDALDEWDSLASLSLITLIEEEFEVQLDDSAVESMTSFEATSAVVARQVT